MNTVIKHITKDMVGKVNWPGWNRLNPQSRMALEHQLIKNIRLKNEYSVKKYLAFCIQEWPDLNECPLDKRIFKDALDILR